LKHVRLRYPGLLAFFSRLGSLGTGLIFSVIVARRLDEQDFGAWGYVSRMVAYLAVVSVMVGYWSARDAARGGRPMATALTISSGFLAPLIALYISLAPSAAQAIGRESSVVLLGLMLLPSLFYLNLSEQIAGGHRPEIKSYAFIAFELMKVSLGYVLVAVLGWELTGVFVTLAIAQVIQFAVLLFLQRDLFGPFDLGDALRWIRGAPIPLLGTLRAFILNLDIVVASAVFGSALPTAYWQAAFSFAIIVGFYSHLAAALYPKLLAGGGERDVTTILSLSLSFAIPMGVGAILIGKDVLLLLRPTYTQALTTTMILIVSYWLAGLDTFFRGIIAGTETFDTNTTLGARDYLNTRLFRFTFIEVLVVSAYLAGLGLASYYARLAGLGPVETAQLWALLHLATHTALTGVQYVMASGVMKIRVPLGAVSRYLVAAVAMALAIQPTSALFPPTEAAIPQAIRLAAIVSTGVSTYLPILYALDKDFRALVSGAVRTLLRLVAGG